MLANNGVFVPDSFDTLGALIQYVLMALSLSLSDLAPVRLLPTKHYTSSL